MNEQPIRFFSHSRVSGDQECRRARYLGSEWGGTGLESVGTAWDLAFGNFQHAFLKGLALNGKIDYQAVRNQVATEAQKAGLDAIACRDWGALAEGQLRGFVRSVWPYWMAEYEILAAEELRKWPVAEGHTFRYIQDILLRSRTDGHLRYVDYKTTSSDKPQWIAAWAKSPQLHSSMYAMQQSGMPVQHAQIVGLYKGYKDEKNKMQRSIFCYGWVNREYSMMPQYSYEYKRGKGWELFSVADEFYSMEKWVEEMPLEILTAQFPRTAPIFLNENVAESWFRQQMLREAEVKEAMSLLETSTDVLEIRGILDKYFPQNFSKCKPAWGHACAFEPICWQPWIGADPLGSKLFVRRDPNHGMEPE